jgi:hypothetical protein
MNIRLFLVTLLLSGVLKGFSQQGHSYRNYKRTTCIDCERAYGRKPVEIDFNIHLQDNTFFALYTDEEWFDDFFTKHNLSLGVQLVSKEYFHCNGSSGGNPDQYFYHTPPVSYRQLKNNMYATDNGWFLSPIGQVPDAFQGKEFDYGLIISKRGRKCIDHWYTLVVRRDWDFLDTALMMDTLVFESDPAVFAPDSIPVVTSKIKEFTVLFQKDQVAFNKDPLLDFVYSLPLADYEILRVDIKAYASIEGPENRNEELYWGRANAIFKDLSQILPENVIYEFDVSEAWEDFLKDISQTSFSGLCAQEAR